MRRIMLLVVGALALALAVPSIASAHGRHHRHHHHARAHHARVEHFNAPANTDPSNPGGPADAGRVASFTNGVLTITLADGSTVSGQVTNDTEINCMAQGATASRDGSSGEGDHGDQSGQGGDQQGGDQGDDNGSGDDDGGQQGQQPSCGTADLVAGALVHEAILKIGGNGAEFKLVLLDQQQAAS